MSKIPIFSVLIETAIPPDEGYYSLFLNYGQVFPY